MEETAGTPRRDSPAEEAWALLGRFVITQRGRFLALAQELDMHPAQMGALAHMAPDTPVPMHRLASKLHCDNSNVTGIVDRLEARGLVARRPDEHDRRVKQIVLTPLGVQLHERIRRHMADAPDSLRQLPIAQQRALRDTLRTVLEGG